MSSATEAQLAELERLASEATPGPIRLVQGMTHYELRAPHQSERSVARVYCDIDGAYIAAAWLAVPALIAEVRRLRQAEHDLRAEFQQRLAAAHLEAARLQGLVNSLANRCAGQSELLNRRAEKSNGH